MNIKDDDDDNDLSAKYYHKCAYTFVLSNLFLSNLNKASSFIDMFFFTNIRNSNYKNKPVY
jgi:hypothetical protein